MWNWPTVRSGPEGGIEETEGVGDRAPRGSAGSRSQETRDSGLGTGVQKRVQAFPTLQLRWLQGSPFRATELLASLHEVRCVSSIMRGGAERRKRTSFLFRRRRGTICTLLSPKQLPTVWAQQR